MGDLQLSSIDATYNNLRPMNNYMDFNANALNFDYKQPVTTKKQIVDTDTYLKQIEEKYEQEYKKKNKPKSKRFNIQQNRRMDNSYVSFESVNKNDNDGYTKVNKSQMPSKFNQDPPKSYRAQEGFHLPSNLTLSKGPSERINESVEQQHWQILEQMHNEYVKPQSKVENRSVQNSQFFSNPQSNLSRISNTSQTTKAKFFDLATYIKDTLPKNHPGRQVLIAQLYSQCQKENIQESNWQKWIQSQLN